MANNNDGYQGWANYQTWNVSLWINNDAGLYDVAKRYRFYGWERLRGVLVRDYGLQITPDGVSLTDPTIDTDELDEMLKEL